MKYLYSVMLTLLMIFGLNTTQAEHPLVAMCTIKNFQQDGITYSFDLFVRNICAKKIKVSSSDFYFVYNSVALSTPTLTNVNSKYSTGGYSPMTVSIDSGKVHVAITYLKGKRQKLSTASPDGELLATIKMEIIDPSQNSSLNWSVPNSGIRMAGKTVINILIGLDESPLPIQLAYFNAVAVNSNSVELTWQTITETNNYGFYVQQSIDNTVSYTDVLGSFIPGQGTTLMPHDYSYTHTSVVSGMYYYRLKQIDLDGTVHYTDGVQVDVLTGIEEISIVESFILSQNYPNPFNPSTTISFTVEVGGRTTLTVFNALGQEIATLFSANAEPGQVYATQFDGTNLANGMYFYKLVSNDQSSIKKLVLLK